MDAQPAPATAPARTAPAEHTSPGSGPQRSSSGQRTRLRMQRPYPTPRNNVVDRLVHLRADRKAVTDHFTVDRTGLIALDHGDRHAYPWDDLDELAVETDPTTGWHVLVARSGGVTCYRSWPEPKPGRFRKLISDLRTHKFAPATVELHDGRRRS